MPFKRPHTNFAQGIGTVARIERSSPIKERLAKMNSVERAVRAQTQWNNSAVYLATNTSFL